MPEYIVHSGDAERIECTVQWLGHLLAFRTLNGEDTGMSRVEAEDCLRHHAVNNPSRAIRQRCWKAMESLDVTLYGKAKRLD